MRYFSIPAVLSLLLLPSLVSADPGPVPSACEAYTGFDLNADGIPEIDALTVLEGPTQLSDAPLLLVLVEGRLRDPKPDPALESALSRFLTDLAADGFQPWLVEARLYAGERHQDGLTLLALRRFFQALWQQERPFAGAVLVGSFPEALLVRTYNWRKTTPITLRKGTPQEKRFSDPVPYLRVMPEVVARRCELVLCDLDGNWEERYYQRRVRLPWTIGVFPDGVPAGGGFCHDFDRGFKELEDVFHVNDGHHDAVEVVRDGQVVGLELRPRDQLEDSECSAGDRSRPNPLARPEILVSRINARGIALSPRSDLAGTSGEGLLNAEGHPQAVTFPEGTKVPHWLGGVWVPDPQLERQLLVEFLDRNHRYRSGAFAAIRRPAAISHGLGNGYGHVRQAAGSWEEEDKQALQVHNADLTQYVQWLKTPALVRDIRAHSDPWGTVFGRPDLEKLTELAGGVAWSWSPKGKQLVPSLKAACGGGKADLALYRTLWESDGLKDQACFYLHTGCDGISPPGGQKVPYHHPRYSYWQGGEALLFYGQGLALVGRSKVFYDAPRGFYPALADGARFGEAWARYFDIEAGDARPGGGIGRKRSYFWSVLGDWTLRLPAIEAKPAR